MTDDEPCIALANFTAEFERFEDLTGLGSAEWVGTEPVLREADGARPARAASLERLVHLESCADLVLGHGLCGELDGRLLFAYAPAAERLGDDGWSAPVLQRAGVRRTCSVQPVRSSAVLNCSQHSPPCQRASFSNTTASATMRFFLSASSPGSREIGKAPSATRRSGASRS
jgi:hypothetical protein